MVIDTSALIAILELEPEAEIFARLIDQDDARLISTVSVLEAGIIVEARKGSPGAEELEVLLQQAEINISAFDAEQAALARLAYRQFGKGRHPAALNLGDCASYALSRLSGEPLLYKGEDFLRTDVASVGWGAGSAE